MFHDHAITYAGPITIFIEAASEVINTQPVNAALIGGVVGAVLAVLFVTAIVLLQILCLYRRYRRVSKLVPKKVDQ
jgi:hypothetical protein